MSSARNEILERIRKALSIPSKQKLEEPDWKKPVFSQKEEDPDLAILFAENFTAKSGQFFYVDNYARLYDDIASFVAERGFTRIACWEAGLAEVLAFKGVPYQADAQQLESIEASFTLCEALVARTGSVLVSSSQAAGRSLSIYPPIHIVVATASQVVADIDDGLALVRSRYPRFPSMVSLISGPSRTADIEKTLVLGAHGPKELIVFLVDDMAPPDMEMEAATDTAHQPAPVEEMESPPEYHYPPEEPNADPEGEPLSDPDRL